MESRLIMRLKASWGLTAITCAAALLVGVAPAPAAADESTPTKPVVCAVGETFAGLQNSIDAQWKTIIEERDLEQQRQADMEAEQQQLAAINAHGEEVAQTLELAQAEAAAAAEAAARAQAEEDAARAFRASEAVIITDDETPMAASPNASSSSTMTPGSLRVLGQVISFAQGSCYDSTAPDGYASTWLGNGSVTDGYNTYFIGHNPGIFAPVMDLQPGDVVTVCDESGATRDYTVFDTTIVPKRSNYYDYEDRIAPVGETITLQTCCPGDATVRCVMAR